MKRGRNNVYMGQCKRFKGMNYKIKGNTQRERKK